MWRLEQLAWRNVTPIVIVASPVWLTNDSRGRSPARGCRKLILLVIPHSRPVFIARVGVPDARLPAIPSEHADALDRQPNNAAYRSIGACDLSNRPSCRTWHCSHVTRALSLQKLVSLKPCAYTHHTHTATCLTEKHQTASADAQSRSKNETNSLAARNRSTRNPNLLDSSSLPIL